MSARRVRKDEKNSIPDRCTPSSALRNPNSNLTLRSNSTSNCRSRLNMTTCLAIPIPTIDWDLQCDLTYGTYLQALMTRQLMTETIKQHTILINDQLSLQADLLEKQITRKCTLEEEIEKLELAPKLKSLLEVLRTLLDYTRSNVNNKTESGLNSLIKTAESACNNLYLKRMKPLDCPQDYEEFENLLHHCLKSLQKINIICRDVDSVQQLADSLCTYKHLCSEITEVHNSIVNLKDQVQTNALCYVSEKLATCRGYN